MPKTMGLVDNRSGASRPGARDTASFPLVARTFHRGQSVDAGVPDENARDDRTPRNLVFRRANASAPG